MRTRAVLSGVFASAAVLVIGWQMGSTVQDAGTSTTATVGSTGSTGSTGTGSVSGSGTAEGATPTTTSRDGTFAGSVAGTRFGNVQVQITVSGGTITDVTALQLTDHDGRSVQISNRAEPVLRSEVLQAQSANVATVGGATYTSEGYLTSLQSALDQAGL